MKINSIGNYSTQYFSSRRTKFTTTDGTKYDDATIVGGQARRYGEPLTGVAEVESRKGDKYKITYKDGYMVNSINPKGAYLKKYTPYGEDSYYPEALSRQKAVLITDRTGKKEAHIYNPFGRISKIIDPKKRLVREYSMDGNKVAEYKQGKNPYRSIEGEVYYDIKSDAPVLKKRVVVGEDGDLIETSYSKDGKILKEKKGGFYHFKNPHTDLLAETKIKMPNEITRYQDGEPERTIRRMITMSEESVEVQNGDDIYGMEYLRDAFRSSVAERRGARRIAILSNVLHRGGMNGGYIYYEGPKSDEEVKKDLPMILKKLKEATANAKAEDMNFGCISYEQYMGDLDTLITRAKQGEE